VAAGKVLPPSPALPTHRHDGARRGPRNPACQRARDQVRVRRASSSEPNQIKVGLGRGWSESGGAARIMLHWPLAETTGKAASHLAYYNGDTRLFHSCRSTHDRAGLTASGARHYKPAAHMFPPARIRASPFRRSTAWADPPTLDTVLTSCPIAASALWMDGLTD
jgi:hypothetical protein